MTTEQREGVAGIIETLQAAAEKLEDRPGVGLVRTALAQAEKLYWEAAEADRLQGIMAA